MRLEYDDLKESIQRFINNIYTVQDIKAFPFLQQHSNILEEEMDNYWEESSEIYSSSIDREKYREEAKVLLDKLRKKERRINFPVFLRYAALFVLVLISGVSLYWFLSEYKENKEPVLYTEIYVENGKRVSISLPDGSRVTLNSGSYLRYPSEFRGSSREIELNGEIFLNVRPDSLRPFIVRTEQAKIKVLGTSFNVKAYTSDQQVFVSVKSGKVQVDLPDASMRLRPDEMLILNKENGELEKRNIDNRKTTAWMKGELYFNQTPVASVAKELERIYNCTIQIENDAIKQELVYGEHSNENLDSVLKSLEYVLGIKYKKEGTNVILYK